MFIVKLVGFKKYKRTGFKQIKHVKSRTVTSLKSTLPKKTPPYSERFRGLVLDPGYLMSGWA